MRIFLKFAAYFTFVIAITAAGFSIWQTYEQGRSLKRELDSRSLIYSENLKPVLKPLLDGGSTEALREYIDDFTRKENLLGVAIEDNEGKSLLISEGLAIKLQKDPRVLEDVVLNALKWNVGYGEYVDLNGRLCYVHSVPIPMENRPPYTLTLFYDTGFVLGLVKFIWINNFARFAIQVFLIFLTIPFLIYFSILKPIKKIAVWTKKVRMGEDVRTVEPVEDKIFAPLIREIARIMKSLLAARLTAEEEARLRHFSESVWTPARLKEFVKTKLTGKSIFVVSNREPYRHIQKNKEIVCVVPASGLVTAIEPILKACGGTWIAQGDGDADRQTVDAQDRLRVPPEEPQYMLRRVWVSEEEEKGYYYGFSNEGLWPLCHIAHTRPIFRVEDWEQYKAVNEKFCKAVLEEIENVDMPYILIQDYHFALLPALIKAERPDARVAIFWHIPWPNPESFGICPWQKELLKGMLGADIIGFHTQFHCNNFLETADRFLESRIDYERFSIHREGQTTWVKPFPISIAFSEDFDTELTNGGSVSVEVKTLLKPYGLSAETIGVGVDRMDYTKGILERFRSVEYFIEKNPRYRGKFTFVELAAPSRSLIPKYKEFSLEVQREVDRINTRFKRDDWQPILLLEKHHSHAEIAPFYKAADVCMVTSLHDGMNLVAKEFVMARSDEKGVLILSQFTGAARELSDALIVNPYDIVQMADSIAQALKMPEDEQIERMRTMREILRERNIYRWAADLVGELGQVKLSGNPRINDFEKSSLAG